MKLTLDSYPPAAPVTKVRTDSLVERRGFEPPVSSD